MPEPIRVLLAEADSISAQLLSFALRREGFEVTQAPTGSEALRIARERRVDMLVSEVMLGDMNGLDLCGRLRAEWNTRNIPIILITTLGSTEERIAGLHAGSDDYLVKPFDQRELTIRIERLLATYANCAQLNLLTGLPSSHVIERYIAATCLENAPWALLHVDVNHFSAYNALFGFEAGDRVLRRTADLLRDVVLSDRAEPAFVGHEGRDDFVLVVNEGAMRRKCDELISGFDTLVAGFYPAGGRDIGDHFLADRQGRSLTVAPLALSIGALTGELCVGMCYLEMQQAALSVLRQAKAAGNSSLFVNRRRMAGRAPGLRPSGVEHRPA